MIHEHPGDVADWTLCHPGTLQTLTGQLRAARRRKAVNHLATPLVLFAMIAASFWATQAILHAESNFGGIWCREVQVSLKLYHEGRLPESLSEKMAVHLRGCPRCQSLLRAMSQPTDEAGVTPLNGSLILASMNSVR